MLNMAAGFAVAFGVLMRHTNTEIEGEEWYNHVLGDAPLWAAFWGILGSLGGRWLSWKEKIDEPQYVIEAMSVFVGVFLFIVLIQLRLLVAMLQSTYMRIIGKSQDFWLFERAQLITEIKDAKPPWPPPFNLLNYLLVSLPMYLESRYRNHRTSTQHCPTTGFKCVPNAQTLRALRKKEAQYHKPVSYTHLTLPTICSV
eukprot:5573019-Prymnesium_polylepis.3